MNIENEIESKKEKIKEQNIEKLVENEITIEKQNNFLETTLGKTINTAIDIGLRSLLPDLIEEQVINIKEVLLKNGLKEGINMAIKSAIDLGKSTIGLATGNFEDLSQIHTAIKKGGIIDSLSKAIDNVLKATTKNNLISSSASRIIKKGKNIILDAISTNLEEKYLEDVKSLEKISKYISNWKNYYNQKNISGMEKEYKKLKQQLDTVVMLEKTVTAAKKVENMHNLIKNKGIEYELSEEEKELVNILS